MTGPPAEAPQAILRDSSWAAAAAAVDVSGFLGEPDLSQVPSFDERARGTPRDWNDVQPFVRWGNKAYRKFGGKWGVPPVPMTTPRIEVVEKFLSLRLDAEGEPVRARIGKPEEKNQGWWRFPWLGADGCGPIRADVCAGAGWERAWHGTKLEGLYSTMYHGRLFVSYEDVLGGRALQGMPGIYCHGDLLEYKAEHYTRFVPLLDDTVVWGPLWEVRVDKDRVVPRRGKKTDQWVQQEGSVELVALWVCGRHYGNLKAGSEELSLCWNPLLEANPVCGAWTDQVAGEPLEQARPLPAPEPSHHDEAEPEALEQEAPETEDEVKGSELSEEPGATDAPTEEQSELGDVGDGDSRTLRIPDDSKSRRAVSELTVLNAAADLPQDDEETPQFEPVGDGDSVAGRGSEAGLEETPVAPLATSAEGSVGETPLLICGKICDGWMCGVCPDSCYLFKGHSAACACPAHDVGLATAEAFGTLKIREMSKLDRVREALEGVKTFADTDPRVQTAASCVPVVTEPSGRAMTVGELTRQGQLLGGVLEAHLRKMGQDPLWAYPTRSGFQQVTDALQYLQGVRRGYRSALEKSGERSIPELMKAIDQFELLAQSAQNASRQGWRPAPDWVVVCVGRIAAVATMALDAALVRQPLRLEKRWDAQASFEDENEEDRGVEVSWEGGPEMTPVCIRNFLCSLLLYYQSEYEEVRANASRSTAGTVVFATSRLARRFAHCLYTARLVPAAQTSQGRSAMNGVALVCKRLELPNPGSVPEPKGDYPEELSFELLTKFHERLGGTDGDLQERLRARSPGASWNQPIYGKMGNPYEPYDASCPLHMAMLQLIYALGNQGVTTGKEFFDRVAQYQSGQAFVVDQVAMVTLLQWGLVELSEHPRAGKGDAPCDIKRRLRQVSPPPLRVWMVAFALGEIANFFHDDEQSDAAVARLKRIETPPTTAVAAREEEVERPSNYPRRVRGSGPTRFAMGPPAQPLDAGSTHVAAQREMVEALAEPRPLEQPGTCIACRRTTDYAYLVTLAGTTVQHLVCAVCAAKQPQLCHGLTDDPEMAAEYAAAEKRDREDAAIARSEMQARPSSNRPPDWGRSSGEDPEVEAWGSNRGGATGVARLERLRQPALNMFVLNSLQVVTRQFVHETTGTAREARRQMVAETRDLCRTRYRKALAQLKQERGYKWLRLTAKRQDDEDLGGERIRAVFRARNSVRLAPRRQSELDAGAPAFWASKRHFSRMRALDHLAETLGYLPCRRRDPGLEGVQLDPSPHRRQRLAASRIRNPAYVARQKETRGQNRDKRRFALIALTGIGKDAEHHASTMTREEAAEHILTAESNRYVLPVLREWETEMKRTRSPSERLASVGLSLRVLENLLRVPSADRPPMAEQVACVLQPMERDVRAWRAKASGYPKAPSQPKAKALRLNPVERADGPPLMLVEGTESAGAASSRSPWLDDVREAVEPAGQRPRSTDSVRESDASLRKREAAPSEPASAMEDTAEDDPRRRRWQKKLRNKKKRRVRRRNEYGSVTSRAAHHCAPKRFGKCHAALPSPFAHWPVVASTSVVAVSTAVAFPGWASCLGAFAWWKAVEVVEEGAKEVTEFVEVMAHSAGGVTIVVGEAVEDSALAVSRLVSTTCLCLEVAVGVLVLTGLVYFLGPAWAWEGARARRVQNRLRHCASRARYGKCNPVLPSPYAPAPPDSASASTESEPSTFVLAARRAAARAAAQAAAHQEAFRAGVAAREAAKREEKRAKAQETDERRRARTDESSLRKERARQSRGKSSSPELKVGIDEVLRRGREAHSERVELAEACRSKDVPLRRSGVGVSPPTGEQWKRYTVTDLTRTEKLALLGMIVRYEEPPVYRKCWGPEGSSMVPFRSGRTYEGVVNGWVERDGSCIGEASPQPAEWQQEVMVVRILRSSDHGSKLGIKKDDVDLADIDYLWADLSAGTEDWYLSRELTGDDRRHSRGRCRPVPVPEESEEVEISISTPRPSRVEPSPAPPPWAGPLWGLLRTVGGGVSRPSAKTTGDDEEEDVFKSLEIAFQEGSPEGGGSSAAGGTDGSDPPREIGAETPAVVTWVEMGIEVAPAQGVLAEQPAIQLLYRPKILPHLLFILYAAEFNICCLQYQCEEHHLVNALIAAVRRKPDAVVVRLVLDKRMMLNPSAKGQPKQVATMIEHGVQVRIRQPGTKGFALQHEKVVTVDDAIGVVGSANWTHNSMENCEESVISTRSQEVVRQMRAHFERVWEDAEELTFSVCQAIHRKLQDRKEQPRASSTPPARTLPRDSSRDPLEPVPEAAAVGSPAASRNTDDSALTGSVEGAGTRGSRSATRVGRAPYSSNTGPQPASGSGPSSGEAMPQVTAAGASTRSAAEQRTRAMSSADEPG